MSTTIRPDQAHTGADLRGDLVIVTVARPRQTGLADWMSHLRVWLNHHGIEPAGFKYHEGAWGDESYEVSFNNGHQAELFAAEFDEEHLR